MLSWRPGRFVLCKPWWMVAILDGPTTPSSTINKVNMKNINKTMCTLKIMGVYIILPVCMHLCKHTTNFINLTKSYNFRPPLLPSVAFSFDDSLTITKEDGFTWRFLVRRGRFHRNWQHHQKSKYTTWSNRDPDTTFEEEKQLSSQHRTSREQKAFCWAEQPNKLQDNSGRQPKLVCIWLCLAANINQ